jgi:hypothetical protein
MHITGDRNLKYSSIIYPWHVILINYAYIQINVPKCTNLKVIYNTQYLLDGLVNIGHLLGDDNTKEFLQI